jgi:hypothetical protein
MNKLLFERVKAFRGRRKRGALVYWLGSSDRFADRAVLSIFWYAPNEYSVQFQSHLCPGMDWKAKMNLRELNTCMNEWEAQRKAVQKYGIFQY